MAGLVRSSPRTQSARRDDSGGALECFANRRLDAGRFNADAGATYDANAECATSRARSRRWYLLGKAEEEFVPDGNDLKVSGEKIAPCWGLLVCGAGRRRRAAWAGRVCDWTGRVSAGADPMRPARAASREGD
jgi:hypothetical protein